MTSGCARPAHARAAPLGDPAGPGLGFDPDQGYLKDITWTSKAYLRPTEKHGPLKLEEKQVSES